MLHSNDKVVTGHHFDRQLSVVTPRQYARGGQFFLLKSDDIRGYFILFPADSDTNASLYETWARKASFVRGTRCPPGRLHSCGVRLGCAVVATCLLRRSTRTRQPYAAIVFAGI